MICTRALAYAYPGSAELVFDDVELVQGSTMVLLGNSGSGKSTWLALAAGLLRPTGGEITVHEQALSRLSAGQLDAWRARTIGFLPQKLHLSEALNVTQNLALAFFAQGLPVQDEAVQTVLERLQIPLLAYRKPSQLSGGQAQRVALARAVLMQPKIILADEPTASLDDMSAAAAMKTLQDCAAQCGSTLIVATHDSRVQQILSKPVVYTLATPQKELV